MKKLLGLFSAFGVIASTAAISANVVSCGNKDDAKSLTYNEGKSDKDVVEMLTNESAKIGMEDSKPLQVKDGKLDADYKDTENTNEDGQKVTIEGAFVISASSSSKDKSFTDEVNKIFKETGDLIPSHNDDDTGFDYLMTIKGSKGSKNFDLNIVKFTVAKNGDKYSYETKTDYRITVTIPSESTK
ncbi:hypothetical protein [Spiroplasma turonicum]|uniref:Lipoprotein n=1 Tax=Spiroplasma turonicum TaxID=216946 RepID=A0A0K1P7I8_9MOLU|nr:hypothetical protein [Spiroplasma turonicum]AKU80276.1 hypothetical protein STURON_001030 [Spiroplasma turonicum]ALX71277.1 hypothetical protein STURO_v1c10260 [Spiroplasma turonicum]